MSDFTALGLSPAMLRALDHNGFQKATPIQEQAVPLIAMGHDVIGVAQTGSGKTAAFVIPLLEKLAVAEDRAAPHMPRALILAPTRELAVQTTSRIKELAVGMRASCCTIYGGTPYKTQIQILRRGVDILIATPGRLLDHMKRGTVHLDDVRYFVLDEADRMLDLGFVDDVRRINKRLTHEHQSVMFSATLSDGIKDLMDRLLNRPTLIDVAPDTTIADNLTHTVLHVQGHLKNEALAYLIETEAPKKSIVFVRTRRIADEMADYLNDDLGLKAESLHGEKPQKIRQRIINGFHDGRFDILVATDVAARGIDVKDISHVFNHDVPVDAENYVHRIGRTARGGEAGKAFTLCGNNEKRQLATIEELIGEAITIVHDHPYRPISKKPARANVKKRPSVARRKAASKKPVRGGRKQAEPAGKKGKKTNRNKGKPPAAQGKPRRGAGRSGKPKGGGNNPLKRR